MVFPSYRQSEQIPRGMFSIEKIEIEQLSFQMVWKSIGFTKDGLLFDGYQTYQNRSITV